MEIYLIFLVCLSTTIIIEGLTILILFKRKDYIYYSVLCNLLTNPAMNLALLLSVYYFGANAYYLTLVTAEIIIVFVEAKIYTMLNDFKIKKAIMLSVLLNTLSFLAGLLVNKLLFVIFTVN